MDLLTKTLTDILEYNEKQLAKVDHDQGQAEDLVTLVTDDDIEIWNVFVDETEMKEVIPYKYYSDAAISKLLEKWILQQTKDALKDSTKLIEYPGTAQDLKEILEAICYVEKSDLYREALMRIIILTKTGKAVENNLEQRAKELGYSRVTIAWHDQNDFSDLYIKDDFEFKLK